jgi:hypothetical protein
MRRMRDHARLALATLQAADYVGSRRGTKPQKSEAIEV